MARTTHFANAPELAPGVLRFLHYSVTIDPVVQKPLNPRHKAGGGTPVQSESCAQRDADGRAALGIEEPNYVICN